MKIYYLNPEGVPKAEQQIHGLIEKEFSKSKFTKDWIGYASFALPLGGANGSLDFDLVLITHRDIIVVELKNWNAKTVSSRNGIWYQDAESRKGSFKTKTDGSAKKLADAMKRRLASTFVPYIKSCVFFHGKVEKFELPASDMVSVFKNKEDFFNLTDSKYYEKRFHEGCRESFKRDKDFCSFKTIYDGFFLNKCFIKERDVTVGGYKKDKNSIFEHPRSLYKEYEGFGRKATERALIRDWDFTSNSFIFLDNENRQRIFHREQDVYSTVEEQAREGTSFLLRPINVEIGSDPNLQDTQLFSLPSQLKMFPNFFNSKLRDLEPENRLNLSKALLSHFAVLHDLRIAHRDLDPHSVWLDSSCRVCLTNFALARIPENKTVGNLIEEAKILNSRFPEEEERKGSDFQRDVYCLGLLCYQLLYLEELPIKDGFYSWRSPQNSGVFGLEVENTIKKSLALDPEHRFYKARDFLEAFNKATVRDQEVSIDKAIFKEFYKKVSLDEYPASYRLVDDESKEVYISEKEGNKYKVNKWYGIGKPEALDKARQMALSIFLNKVRQIQTTSTSVLPNILDAGLWRGEAIVVSEWIDGVTVLDWLKDGKSEEEVFSVALKLIEAMTKIHDLGIYHGDLHPGNIVVTADNEIKFIDFLDLRLEEDDPVNPQYLPDNYSDLPTVERDRWEIFRTLGEIFNPSNIPSISFFKTPKELSKLQDLKGTVELEPLKLCIKEDLLSLHKKPLQLIVCPIVKSSERLNGLEPLVAIDNIYYLSVAQGKDRKNCVRIFISGQDFQIKLIYNYETETVEDSIYQKNLSPRGTESRHYEININCIIQIKKIAKNEKNNFLFELKKNFPEVKTFIESRIEKLNNNLNKEAPKELDLSLTTPLEEKPVPSVVSIWQGLLEAEEKADGEITLQFEPKFIGERAIVPIEGYDFDFDEDETVLIESKRYDGEWITVGKLVIEDSTLEFLVINEIRDKSKLSIGKTIRIISQQAKLSFIRREKAINKILENRAPIQDLPNYFDPNKCLLMPLKGLNVELLNEDNFQFNSDQMAAFKKILSNGPVTFLQGPPGTGKTFFIANLMDFLINNNKAEKILLTSQSHEAVNNSLERYARLRREKGLNCSAVRIGNIKAISEEIQEFYDFSIRNSARELFIAEENIRLKAIGKEIGLPEDFLEEFISVYKDLSGLLNNFRTASGKQRENLEDIILRKLTSRNFPEDLITRDPEKDIPSLFNYMRQEYGSISESDYKKFIQVLKLSFEWEKNLANQNANYTDFLLQTRNIIAGTLVGLGKKTYGVSEQLFDWVIVDEAARANPTEIAVAIQSAKRILLVGDQAQLQPMYPDAVKEMLRTKFPSIDENYLFSSDFERVYEYQKERNGAALLTQYRMIPSIGRLVSECFYEGKLRNGISRRPDYFDFLTKSPLDKEILWIDYSDNSLGFEKRTKEGSCTNPYEADLAMELVYKLLSQKEFVEKYEESNITTPLIGVIALYAAQKNELCERFDNLPITDNLRKLVKIDTVDSYQGKENSIVILCTVRHNTEKRIGFLKSPNRINVAISRAKHSLFILGSSYLWEQMSNSPLSKVLEYLKTVGVDKNIEILKSHKCRDLLT